MSALDRPVRVPLVPPNPLLGSFDESGSVVPADVVAAHNAQTEDPADHLMLRGDLLDAIALAESYGLECRDAGYAERVERQRDEARADAKHRAEYLVKADAEVERLRVAAEWLLTCHDNVERRVPVRNYDEAWEGLRHAVAREALGEKS